MFSKNSKEQINSSIIGESVLIEGTFDCLEDVVVHGKLNGIIKTSADVYIKQSSVVNADIKAKNLFLDGVVNGNVDCLEYVGVSASAKINGDVSTKVINIEKGAIFNGKCIIREDKKLEDVGKNNVVEGDVIDNMTNIGVKIKGKKQVKDLKN